MQQSGTESTPNFDMDRLVRAALTEMRKGIFRAYSAFSAKDTESRRVFRESASSAHQRALQLLAQGPLNSDPRIHETLQYLEILLKRLESGQDSDRAA